MSDDAHGRRMRERAEAKLAGDEDVVEAPEAEPAEEPEARVIDLMEALRRSMEKRGAA